MIMRRRRRIERERDRRGTIAAACAANSGGSSRTGRAVKRCAGAWNTYDLVFTVLAVFDMAHLRYYVYSFGMEHQRYCSYI